jgi:hypothetical protein
MTPGGSSTVHIYTQTVHSIDVDSHTFLSLKNDLLAFCILTLTSIPAPPSSASALSK